MSTFTNPVTKNQSNATSLGKNVVSWDSFERAGGIWFYDDANLLYSAERDLDTGLAVYYEGMGTLTTFNNQNSPKNIASWDSLEKAGGIWFYEDANLLYDSESDPDTNLAVYYEQLGMNNTYSNLSKN